MRRPSEAEMDAWYKCTGLRELVEHAETEEELAYYLKLSKEADLEYVAIMRAEEDRNARNARSLEVAGYGRAA